MKIQISQPALPANPNHPSPPALAQKPTPPTKTSTPPAPILKSDPALPAPVQKSPAPASYSYGANTRSAPAPSPRLCTRAEAEQIFNWAANRHGGGWVGHSRTAARVAETIARRISENSPAKTPNSTPEDSPTIDATKNSTSKTTSPETPAPTSSETPETPKKASADHPTPATPNPSLDPTRAYVLALLHDVGRYEGNTQLHHILAGYHLLRDLGFPAEARICLTHSCYSIKLAKNPTYWPGIDDPRELRFLVNFINTVKFDDYDRLIQLADLLSLEAGVFTIADRFCDSVSRYRLSDPQEDLRARRALKSHFDHLAGLNIYDLFHDEILQHALEN